MAPYIYLRLCAQNPPPFIPAKVLLKRNWKHICSCQGCSRLLKSWRHGLESDSSPKIWWLETWLRNDSTWTWTCTNMYVSWFVQSSHKSCYECCRYLHLVLLYVKRVFSQGELIIKPNRCNMSNDELSNLIFLKRNINKGWHVYNWIFFKFCVWMNIFICISSFIKYADAGNLARLSLKVSLLDLAHLYFIYFTFLS